MQEHVKIQPIRLQQKKAKLVHALFEENAGNIGRLSQADVNALFAPLHHA